MAPSARRLLVVGDDQLGVDLHPGAEPGALRAGAPRAVEGELPRLELVDGDVVLVRAGHLLRVATLPARDPSASRSTKSTLTTPWASPRAVSTESVSRRLTVGFTASRSTTTSMECLYFLSSVGGSVRAMTSPSTRARLKPWPASWRNRSTYSPLRPRTTGASTWKRVPSGSAISRSTICCGDCLLIGSPQIGQCGRPARANSKPEVVVDLGDGADRRPWVAAGRLLVDRDRRRQTLDEVDVRLVHLAQELPRVRGQRLDIAALALGEDGVEGQARLAGSGEAGEHDERVAREVEGDVAQVVLAGTPHDRAGQSRRTCYEPPPTVSNSRTGWTDSRLIRAADHDRFETYGPATTSLGNLAALAVLGLS